MIDDRPIERLQNPSRHVLICEDDLSAAAAVLFHFTSVFPSQGRVRLSVVSSGRAAAAVVEKDKAACVVLDYDMPDGDGMYLLHWMGLCRVTDVPVITSSGLASNNQKLADACTLRQIPFFLCSKFGVAQGLADEFIKGVCGV